MRHFLVGHCTSVSNGLIVTKNESYIDVGNRCWKIIILVVVWAVLAVKIPGVFKI